LRRLAGAEAGVAELWPHQRAGVVAAAGELAAGGRASLVMACGTGKTAVGAELSRRLAPAGPVLVVVTTLELLAQTAQRYASWLGADAGHIVAVCGDAGAADAAAGELREQMAGLHAQVTTDPAVLAGLAGSGRRVTVLATYASLPAVAAAHRLHGLGAWELAVVDEAHRSAGHGAKAWAVIHWDAQIPAVRRLYLTATPRIMTGAGGDEVVSMDDAAVFGRIVHEVPFAEAISNGLLADYRVAAGVVTDAEVAKLTAGTAVASVSGRPLPARLAACQVTLARAIREWDLRRVITYHGRVTRAARFAATLPDTLALMSPAQRPVRPVMADYLSGAMSLAARRERLALLAGPGEHTMVLSNARVLGEGVDVPELDAIMIADPKYSVTDVVQAVGRALRRGAGAGKTATIVVPVLVHDGQGAGAVDSTAFETVWRVLRALRAHDERIATWLDEHRQLRARGRGGQEPEPPPWLHVTGTPVDHAFTAAISIRAVQVTGTPWTAWLAALREFRQAHGHASPPREYQAPGGLALGNWLHSQRAARRAGRLDAQRAAALEDLGVEWSVHGTAWWRGYERAAAHRAACGHLAVPDGYRTSDGFGLASWLGEQRKARRAGRLDAQRAAALDALGIEWIPLDAAWQRAYGQAAAYHTAHGHLSVPTDYRTSAGLDLASWLSEQRQAHRAGKLTPDRVTALERLGMAWDRSAITFATGLAHLDAYRQAHGNVDVPAGYHASDGFALHAWLARQRRAYDAGQLAPDRAAALEAAGIQRRPVPPSWQECAAALAAYAAQHGHAKVPRTYVTPSGIRLGAWVHTQRQRRRHPGRNQSRPLTADQIAILDQVGMIWEPARTLRRQASPPP
jgi:superfamily II DNA or RNA helicase